MKKNKREPVRCAKCQRYGHIARDCISHRDMCANCAEDHRTSDCNNKNNTCCTSCHSTDHPSWSRTCPEFERRCADLDARDLDNTLPYFPTDESWTQVQAPPRPKPYSRPQQNTLQEPTHHPQDTLDRHLAPREEPHTRGPRNMRGCYLPPQARMSSRPSNYTPQYSPNLNSYFRSLTPAPSNTNYHYE